MLYAAYQCLKYHLDFQRSPGLGIKRICEAENQPIITEEPSTEINPQRFVKTYILPTHLPKSSKIPCDVWVTNIH